MNAIHELAVTLENITAKQPSMNLGKAWAQELHCRENSADFNLALSVLQAKAESCSGDIVASSISDRAKNLYSTALSDLMRFLTPRTAANGNVAELINQRSKIDLLFLAADSLPHVPVPNVEQATLDALREKLRKLIEEADGIEIDPHLGSMIRIQLSTLLMSLDSYTVLGPDGVAKIYGLVASELTRLSQASTAQEAKPKRFLKKSLKVIKTVGAVVVWAGAFVSGADAILVDGSHLLGLDDGADDCTE